MSRKSNAARVEPEPEVAREEESTLDQVAADEVEVVGDPIPTVLAEFTLTDEKRGNRDPYFVANDIINADVVSAVRNAVKTLPRGKSHTFIIAVK